MNLIKSACFATISLVLLAASAQAHVYLRHGNQISQTDQWDTKQAAPFSRDENDRFTQ